MTIGENYKGYAQYVGWVKPNIYFFVIHYLYLL